MKISIDKKIMKYISTNVNMKKMIKNCKIKLRPLVLIIPIIKHKEI